MSDAFDVADRELCPDGACIGLIGPDGTCKECGAVAVPGAAASGDSWGDDPEDEPSGARGERAGDAAGERAGGAFDPDNRELCPDGACIGLIGPDGRCKECGTASPNAGLDPRTRGLRSEEEVAEQLEANIIKGDLSTAPDDYAERQLCPDGACIGVIGPDGRCKECGRPADEAPADED